MKMKKWMAGLWVGFVALGGWAEVTVSNLSASQRPGTKRVELSFDVSSSETNAVTVSLVVSNGASAVSCPSVTGDVGAGVTTGAGKSIVWNAGADWDGNVAELMLSVVGAVASSGSGGGTYLVIDLSGGTAATSYPVSSLSSLPNPVPDEYKTTKLVLRRIPAGSFTMGSPSGEVGRDGDEQQHSVTLSDDFYMGVFELTQRQWELVMGNTPSRYKADKYPVEQVSYNDIRGSSSGSGWPANGNVDATSFMGKLRQRTGLTGLDLPTEAQWEYACRAGTIRAYNDQTKNGGEGSDCLRAGSGSDANLDPLGIYYMNDPGHEANVGTKQANAWGLYDMHGNVWEWCLDWYGTYPGTVTDPTGATSGSDRVYRGGDWYNGARFCRSANRNGYYPNHRYYTIGFRVCSAPLVIE